MLCALERRSRSATPQLARTIAGVSQKMLTQTLRTLERDGLLTRTVDATVPVTVTYELTDSAGRCSWSSPSSRRWAESHMDEVLVARGAYDAQP